MNAVQQMPAKLQAAASAAASPRPTRAQRVRAGTANLLASVGHTFGGIFFIPQPWPGLVLALALVSELQNLAFALAGLSLGALANRLLGFVEEPGAGGGVWRAPGGGGGLVGAEAPRPHPRLALGSDRHRRGLPFSVNRP